MKMYLHTLGDALITVGETEIRPTAPMMFAALLYLGVERGRRVPRAALRELLFPDKDERSGAQSLRQLLYKLRQLGAPVDCDAAAVWIAAEDVVDSSASKLEFDVERAAVGLVPGYEPPSPAFAEWLDERRAATTAQLRLTFLENLGRARSEGDVAKLQRLSAALLSVDPLNEEATVAQAEVLALTGQKAGAVRVLTEYADEVGRTSPDLPRRATVLQRRIAERFDGSPTQRPLIGRDEELSWLLKQFERAQAGHPTLSVIWGDAGIGKSRLLAAFTQHMHLRKTQLVTSSCKHHDTDRPFGALADILPMLLDLPGALGVSPDSMDAMRSLLRKGSRPQSEAYVDPDAIALRIRRAFLDLFACVTTESPLVLALDDAHWLDTPSNDVLIEAVSSTSNGLQIIHFRRTVLSAASDNRVASSTFVKRLAPLPASAADTLFRYAVGTRRAIDDEMRCQSLALAMGNPLFICTIAEHLKLNWDAPRRSDTLTDLLRQRITSLDETTLLLLRTVAALGAHATTARVRQCTEMAGLPLMLALQQLADLHLIRRTRDRITCSHDLVSETALADTPEALKLVLFEHVADTLERDGGATRGHELLWACAHAWQQAARSDKTIMVLEQCADFALDVGQISFALTALDAAIASADGAQRVRLLTRAVTLADQSMAHQKVLSLISFLRHEIGVQGDPPVSHDDVELAEYNALASLHGHIWDFHSQLRLCATDPTASPTHRHRAALSFIVGAAIQCRPDAALSLYSELDDLLEDGSPEALHLRTTVCALFGDMSAVVPAAREVLRTVGLESDIRRHHMVGNAARALCWAGELEEGIEAMKRSVTAKERLGMSKNALLERPQVVAFYVHAGRIHDARAWHASVSDSVEQRERPTLIAFHLSNEIELALIRGDVSAARQALSTLQSFGEAKATHGRRAIIAFEIILAEQDGRLDPARFDLAELEHLDAICHSCVEHNTFAIALFVVGFRRGLRLQAHERMRDYICNWRRERFPLLPYASLLRFEPELREALLESIASAEAETASNAAAPSACAV